MTPYELAKKELGTLEWKDGSNPKVVAYYRDAGHPEVTDDDVAWCAAFVGAMIKRAGGKPTGTLLARDYLKWGIEVAPRDIREGDILVFRRGSSAWQGHVTFATEKPAKGRVKCLGGNQSDAVTISTYSLDALLGARRWPGPAATSKPATPPTPPPATPAVPAPSFWASLFKAIAAIFGKR